MMRPACHDAPHTQTAHVQEGEKAEERGTRRQTHICTASLLRFPLLISRKAINKARANYSTQKSLLEAVPPRLEAPLSQCLLPSRQQIAAPALKSVLFFCFTVHRQHDAATITTARLYINLYKTQRTAHDVETTRRKNVPTIITTTTTHAHKRSVARLHMRFWGEQHAWLGHGEEAKSES